MELSVRYDPTVSYRWIVRAAYLDGSHIVVRAFQTETTAYRYVHLLTIVHRTRSN